MPFHLYFDESDLLRCRFALSPLWETQEAVRTLSRAPGGTATTCPGCGGSGRTPPGWTCAAVAADAATAVTIQTSSARRPLGPFATFAEEIAPCARSIRRPPATTWRARSPTRRAACDSPAGQRLLADPARAVRELAELLERASQLFVEPHWPRLRARSRRTSPTTRGASPRSVSSGCSARSARAAMAGLDAHRGRHASATTAAASAGGARPVPASSPGRTSRRLEPPRSPR